MNVLFNPPHLQSARQAESLLQAVSELPNLKVPSEIRVLQQYPHAHTRLVFIMQGKRPVSMDLPSDWLDSERTEDMHERLSELVRSANS